MNVPELVAACAGAVLAGTTITLSLPVGAARWPHGFPRGELLSVGSDGSKNAAFDPVKVLAWVQKATQNARAIHGGFDVTPETRVSFEVAGA